MNLKGAHLMMAGWIQSKIRMRGAQSFYNKQG